MSAAAIVQVGDDTVIEFSFTLINTDTLADPDEVYVLHRDPFLAETVYEYNVDPEIVRLGVGQYKFTITLGNQPRTHVFRTLGDGNVNKAQSVTIEVTESYFDEPLPD